MWRKRKKKRTQSEWISFICELCLRITKKMVNWFKKKQMNFHLVHFFALYFRVCSGSSKLIELNVFVFFFFSLFLVGYLHAQRMWPNRSCLLIIRVITDVVRPRNEVYFKTVSFGALDLLCLLRFENDNSLIIRIHEPN